MGKGLNEVFGELIHGTKGKVVVGPRPLTWGGSKIPKHIMHPPHVPLKVKAQAPDTRWLSNLRKCSGFLCNTYSVGVFFVNGLVKLLDEFDCLQILVTAQVIGNPLALFSSIVQIEHRCNRIYAEAIYPKSIQPSHSTPDKKTSDLWPTVIVTQRAPSACRPCLGSSCSKRQVPSKRANANSSSGK